MRLVAEVLDGTRAGRRELWLRILGDDDRGYLVVGEIDLPDFWFPRLELAIDATENAGVPRSAWGPDASSPADISARMHRRSAVR